MENLGFLLASVTLTAGRNITSKKTATDSNEKSAFFISQALLFGAAALLLLPVAISEGITISPLTWVLAIIYGVLLILSQWMLTLALKGGNTSICTVVYAMGFILPTISGALFWNEKFSFVYGLGVLLAIAVILLTAKKNNNEKQTQKSFVLFIILAMLASGGLGIMQKVQGTSRVADEKSIFLVIAFIIAFLVSLVAFLLCRKKSHFNLKMAVSPIIAGGCFGGANLCNTILAGRMNSAVFFPVQNISTILLTTLLGIIFFKEKITLKTAIILLLGVGVILLFSIK